MTSDSAGQEGQRRFTLIIPIKSSHPFDLLHPLTVDWPSRQHEFLLFLWILFTFETGNLFWTW